MKLLTPALVLSTLLSANAFAAGELDLAKARNCLACHAIDAKVVGPAYVAVAAKYAGQKGAANMLIAKIMKGGSGVWSAVPMPANPQVTENEARRLAEWILSLK